ncbi:ABC transporter permease [Micromonospora sp. NPDC005305]|uniref:ABC transporter permease n=1 Tax=Micromonospora sp. NPDC005305 TaxID=3156875 RepID=UPI0033B02274
MAVPAAGTGMSRTGAELRLAARRRVFVGDVLREAAASMRAQGLKAVLVIAGVVVATATLVTMSGLSSTLSRQVTDEFDSFRATELVVTQAAGATSIDFTEPGDLERVRAISGVVHAGVMDPPGTFLVERPPSSGMTEVAIQPVDADALRAIRPHLTVGTPFNSLHVRSRSPLIMLSESAARRLGVARPGTGVRIDGLMLTVSAIYSDVDRRDEVLVGALVPRGVFTTSDGSSDDRARVLIETQSGAADAVRQRAAIALAPEDGRVVSVSRPLDASGFRQGIEGNVRSLALGVVLIALVMGTISIASSAVSSVHARTAELGLRTVVGALRRHIFFQIMAETLALGLAGAVIGAYTGVAVVVGISTWNGWRPVLTPVAIASALLAGAAAGIVAGLPPAWRAVRLQPVDALRRQ